MRIESILNYLSAFPWEDVKEAFERLNQDHVHQSQEYRKAALEHLRAMGWVEHAGAVPSGFEWQQIGHKVFVRDPSTAQPDPARVTVQGSKKAGTRHREHKKTDTSVKPVADLQCPRCGGELYKEGICPGCDEGRRGFKVRLLCGECDYSLSL